MVMNFHKYQGTGNDFIIVNNLDNSLDSMDIETIQFLCDRNFGIGADGFIKINRSEQFDFDLDYYNSDGSKSFCGNGARCAVTYVRENLFSKVHYTFSAFDGLHEANIKNLKVALKMKNTVYNQQGSSEFILNTGSPHYVQYVNDLKTLDVSKEGREIRYSERFNAEGINVNFVKQITSNAISIRTYERGVENETLSCGTGATACAIVNAIVEDLYGCQKIEVEVKGGKLEVDYNRLNYTDFEEILLIGPAEKVFEGRINLKE